MLRLWHQTRDGWGGPALLPEGGGLMDQPSIVVQAFDAIATHHAEAREAEQPPRQPQPTRDDED